MAIQQEDHARARGSTELEFPFVDVFPDVLAAVMQVEVALSVRHQPQEEGARLEVLQGADVHAGAAPTEVVEVVRFQGVCPTAHHGDALVWRVHPDASGHEAARVRLHGGDVPQS